MRRARQSCLALRWSRRETPVPLEPFDPLGFFVARPCSLSQRPGIQVVRPSNFEESLKFRVCYVGLCSENMWKWYALCIPSSKVSRFRSRFWRCWRRPSSCSGTKPKTSIRLSQHTKCRARICQLMASACRPGLMNFTQSWRRGKSDFAISPKPSS